MIRSNPFVAWEELPGVSCALGVRLSTSAVCIAALDGAGMACTDLPHGRVENPKESRTINSEDVKDFKENLAEMARRTKKASQRDMWDKAFTEAMGELQQSAVDSAVRALSACARPSVLLTVLVLLRRQRVWSHPRRPSGSASRKR
jgi:hypothetical protein